MKQNELALLGFEVVDLSEINLFRGGCDDGDSAGDIVGFPEMTARKGEFTGCGSWCGMCVGGTGCGIANGMCKEVEGAM